VYVIDPSDWSTPGDTEIVGFWLVGATDTVAVLLVLPPLRR